MINACMRALTATGWLNFRMRSMLMSFTVYHLWLNWKGPALHLAHLFTDYEPGIHYGQVQMRSGTTGINAVRVYNPIKQSLDQDPEGAFIRCWVPELCDMPSGLIHTPWFAPDKIGGYPKPLVEEKQARTQTLSTSYSPSEAVRHIRLQQLRWSSATEAAPGDLYSSSDQKPFPPKANCRYKTL